MALASAPALVLAQSAAQTPSGQSAGAQPANQPAMQPAMRPAGTSRMGVLDAARQPVGMTPTPSPETLRRFQQYVEGVVDTQNTLDLISGRPRILKFRKPPSRIQIPDLSVARFDVLSDSELSLTGLAVGATTLNIWFTDPARPDQPEVLSYLVRVLPDPEAKERIDRSFQALQDEINGAFPRSQVRLALVGDTVLVEGQAHDVTEASRIIQIVEANAPVVGTSVPLDQLEDTPSGVGTINNPGGSGSVGQTITPGLRRFGLTNADESRGVAGNAAVTVRRAKVMNLLRVPGQQQVMLRVTVAEVNRAASRAIGLNFSITNNSGVNIFRSLTGGILTGGSSNLPVLLDNGQINLAIQALRGLSYARSLAEPNLVAMNGQTASFQAGGEFPVPVVTGATNTGLQGVEFVPFGVQLHFTPFISDGNRIRLNVAAEVSTRNTSTGATVGGSSVSGRDTRNFSTVVELRSGQTMAVAGLIQTTVGGGSDKVPGAGDLPVVGWLFGSQRTSSNEQELVILVTPELVSPLDAAELPAHLPGSDVFEPDDMEFYVLNRLESRHKEDARMSVRTDWDRLIRTRSIERKYIIGPTGHSDGR